MDRKCGNCIYWEYKEELSSQDRCRLCLRYPPTIQPSAPMPQFPFTWEEIKCGEWIWKKEKQPISTVLERGDV